MPTTCHASVRIAFLVALAALGCERPADPPAASSPQAADRMHGELLIGYDIVSSTLSDLSRLRMLKLFKKLTLAGPVDEVSQVMEKLAAASKQHAKELEKLRKLDPDVSQAPATRSPMGDAITEVATSEMMSWEGAFNLRFILLQAQATRMIGAIATAIARFEPNPERKPWLTDLAAEFESYRDGLVEVVRVYVTNKRAAQQKK